MNSRHGLALVLAAGLGVAACAPAKTPPPSTTGPSSDDQIEKGVKAAYQGWSQADVENPDCSVYFAACVDTFIRKVGLDPEAEVLRNPRAFMDTVDATRIPGWKDLPRDDGRAHITYAALTYAATMRVYFDTCRKEADAEIAARDAESKRLHGDIDAALALPNSYARLSRLVSLRTEEKRSNKDSIGPRYDIEVALFDAFKAAHKEPIYELRTLRVEDAGELRPSLSPDEERDLHCIVRGMPTWQDPETIPADYLQIPVDDAKKDALLAKADAAKDLLAKLPARDRKYPSLAMDAASPDGGELMFGKDVQKIPMFVKSAAPDSADPKVLVVQLFGTVDEKGVEYDCKETQKIDRVKPKSGAVEYVRECKKRDQTRTLTLTLRLPEAPDAPITPGEQLTFLGTPSKLEKKESKKKGKPKEWQIDTTGDVTVTHVLEVWRERLLVGDYFSG
ncbi:MAG TPA: hypothetical protein VL400_24260 [Polyangiaceae bacterium]|jgi:hypothetical protein|nr:hypothetical protein [Polyangiaceae bacterium]